MSEPAVSPVGGARFTGFATVTEAGLQGMITLRADLGDAGVLEAVRGVTGLSLPGARTIVTGDDGRAVAWMAPDEALVLVPRDATPDIAARLRAALDGHFATVAEVSDARAVFRVEGAQARAVLAKLCPVDLARLPRGEIRRTRCGQVAAAIWQSGDDAFTLVAFRSVAQYVFDLLRDAARPGGEVGAF